MERRGEDEGFGLGRRGEEARGQAVVEGRTEWRRVFGEGRNEK